MAKKSQLGQKNKRKKKKKVKIERKQKREEIRKDGRIKKRRK